MASTVGTAQGTTDTTTRTAPTAAPGRRVRHRWSAGDKRRLRTGLLFVSPWIVGVCVFVLYPLIYSVVISLTRYSGMLSPTFVGLQNYVSAFTDPLTRTAAGNTVFYACLAVPIGLVVAVVLALCMNRNVREVAVYRAALYIPSLVPAFALAFVFAVFVNPTFGLISRVLSAVGFQRVDLLQDPTTAKVVIVIMAQLGAGNAALIFLAGLRNIPKTIYEAARVDGASPFRQFTAITLPLLSPAILFNLITGISGALQVFTEAYVLTNGTGNPDNGTLFYMMYLYKNAFSYASLGYASALAVLLFLVGMVLAVVVYWLSRRFVNYDVSAG
ncbi:multiple sugar transport system permease protein [Friedmanniella endophytica]|uniref:Multiple sugar transport system permease protein n=1 Tax=Microlunatus kandeliicorticis TaxID=1759536 RepID=A0A7W3IPF3_9ACTN|nr:sugar ABC transporter permease [Microlunatus kandeliicorticis]MBA8792799.1 multiple sugar transport system permease protein [Microlunatus kandeliicorticis]